MKCNKCGSRRVLAEGLLDGKTKLNCQECGAGEVLDAQGRRMLTDDMPAPDRREYLTS